MNFQEYKNYKIFYNETGGGDSYGRIFDFYIGNTFKNRTFKNTLEWCSGAGFMGWRLYFDGVTEKISFLEKHQPIIKCLQQTKDVNNAVANIYQGSQISTIPLEEKFDLIVGNPPWFLDPISAADAYKQLWKPNGPNNTLDTDQLRRAVDINWQTHLDFIGLATDYLTTNGKIILIETRYGILDFEKQFGSQLADAGLFVSNVFNSDHPALQNIQAYLVEMSKA